MDCGEDCPFADRCPHPVKGKPWLYRCECRGDEFELDIVRPRFLDFRTTPADGSWVDPYTTEPPRRPCPYCDGTDWHRAGDGWVCDVCHPPVEPA